MGERTMLEMFKLPFMQAALAASCLIGLMCSFLGVYVVLRRIVFAGIALAQMSALGVAVAIYWDKNPALFAFLFTLVGIIVLSPGYGKRIIPPEAVIGIAFVASWAFAILILSKAAHGEADMVNLLQGNILGATREDIIQLLIVFVPVAAIHVLFYRQFLFTSFDPEMAQTLGMKSPLWSFLFFVTLGLVVAVSMKVSGVLLTFSFLVVPSVAALLAGSSMRANFIFSIATALASAVLGIMLSYRLDLPTGPSIVGVNFILFLVIAACKGLYVFFARSNAAKG
jgi:ABC-type Mn2+/Zn2+ transport system permease subunit